MKSLNTRSTHSITWFPFAALVAFACVLALVIVVPTANAVQSGDADLTPLSALNESGESANPSEPVNSGESAAKTTTTTTAAKVSGISVTAQARVKGLGWLDPVAAGETAGVTEKRGLRAIKLSLTGATGLSGSIRYRTYDRGLGWGATVSDGASSGRISYPVQAVKVWLTGEVAKHYDVLYRVHVAGKGWTSWTKGKGRVGTTKGNAYVTAVQVKLSPKTLEAAGKKASKVGVRYEAHLKSKGWLDWKADGKVAGSRSKSSVIDRFILQPSTGTLSGTVKYRAYIQGREWSQGWKSGGEIVGVSGKRIEALKFKLTGDLKKNYDIYYRSFVYGYGWLDWAKNGASSGSTGYNLPIAAVQVKLVTKGADAPGATEAPTVNLTRHTLNGIDISSWQAGINLSAVPADFVIVKATGGTAYVNPNYVEQADGTLNTNKLLGLYHYARENSCRGSAVKEADHFVDTIQPYIGKAVLVLDFEAEALVQGPSWAKRFLDRVYARTKIRPLIYMSKNPTHEMDWSKVAKKYKLWVAQYPNYNETWYQTDPWTDDKGYGAWDAPTIFQYTSSGKLQGYSGHLDLNLFYGNWETWKILASKS